MTSYFPKLCFNPRARAGRDLNKTADKARVEMFQSTRRAGRDCCGQD